MKISRHTKISTNPQEPSFPIHLPPTQAVPPRRGVLALGTLRTAVPPHRLLGGVQVQGLDLLGDVAAGLGRVHAARVLLQGVVRAVQGLVHDAVAQLPPAVVLGRPGAVVGLAPRCARGQGLRQLEGLRGQEGGLVGEDRGGRHFFFFFACCCLMIESWLACGLRVVG